jgi:hypothetical protein
VINHVQIQSDQCQARERVARAVMCGPAAYRGERPGALELQIARKNALGLEFVAHYPDAVDLLQQEQRRQDEFQRVMQATSRLLQAHEIDHICIKFRKRYRYYDSNVDVIVAQQQWTHAVALLSNEGYEPHIMFKEPDKIMFDKPGEVSVHMHPGVTWNGVPYFDEQALWRHSTPSADGPWCELSDDYHVLVNLAHNVFENYEVSLGDVLFFKRFMANVHLDPADLERIAADNGWRYGFQQAYAQMCDLVTAWDRAEQSGEIPVHLLDYPYQIGMPVLARAFSQRVAGNLAGKRLRMALREIYAYPAFYVLKRRHDLPWLVRLESWLRP